MNIVFPICNDAIEHATKNKTFACFYSDVPPPSSNSIHMHNCCEILLCLKGSGTVFIDDKTYSLERGNVYVANPYEAHMFLPDDPYNFERYILEIDPAFLYSSSTESTDLGCCFFLRDTDISHKIFLDEEQMSKLLSLFENLRVENVYGDDVIKNITAIAVITLVNTYFTAQNKKYSYHSSLENKTVELAVNYINANYQSQLNLDLVAKNSFVSVKELCRLFKNHLGTTVGKYILSKRISEAKRMLKSGFSVQQTAESCGFADYTSFIRTFGKAVGISPGKYKREE